MDLHNLFYSCRVGDLERVKQLVEEREVEVNVRDQWDSTPLYYACLCGHKDIVEYLLSIGARCAAHTFDGERCIYGALDNEIRALLTRDYKVLSKCTKRREPFSEFLRRLCTTGAHADMTFMVHDRLVHVHRCVLAARCAYFNSMFENKWASRNVVHIRHRLVNADAFIAIIQYIYTGQLEIAVSLIEDVKRLAKQCNLKLLQQRLQKFQRDANFFERTKPGTHVTSVLVEQSTDERELSLNEQFVTLAERALPAEMRHWVGSEELPVHYVDLDDIMSAEQLQLRPQSAASNSCDSVSTRRNRTTSTATISSLEDNDVPHMDDAPREELAPSCNCGVFADVIFLVEQRRFACHRAFFAGRSDYFKTLLSDPLHEFGNGSADIPVVPLRHIHPKVFATVIYYIYADAADRMASYLHSQMLRTKLQLSIDTVVDTLVAADLYLLPGLKRQCAVFLAKSLNQHNVIEALELARMFDQPRLEDQCYQYIAHNFELIMHDSEFHRLILSDAADVQAREEIDSVDIVDNIRYHMSIARSFLEAGERLQMLDQLLETLNIEA